MKPKPWTMRQIVTDFFLPTLFQKPSLEWFCILIKISTLVEQQVFLQILLHILVTILMNYSLSSIKNSILWCKAIPCLVYSTLDKTVLKNLRQPPTNSWKLFQDPRWPESNLSELAKNFSFGYIIFSQTKELGMSRHTFR